MPMALHVLRKCNILRIRVKEKRIERIDDWHLTTTKKSLNRRVLFVFPLITILVLFVIFVKFVLITIVEKLNGIIQDYNKPKLSYVT